MSYNESDFPGLLKILNSLNETYNNPALSDKLIKEATKTYEFIPLYPGLVSNSVANMIKKNIEKFEINDWISFEYNGDKYAGHIKEIKDSNIIFNEIVEIKTIKNFSINKDEIKNCIKVNEKQLNDDWPMLIFDKK